MARERSSATLATKGLCSHALFMESFKDMELVAKPAFWQSLGSDGSPKALHRVMEDVLSNIRSETKIVRNGGGYYPLGYYKRNGWLAWRVKKFCSDKRRHPLFGCMTYKVAIEESADESRGADIRERPLAGKRAGAAAIGNDVLTAGNRAAEQAKTAKKEEEKAIEIQMSKES